MWCLLALLLPSAALACVPGEFKDYAGSGECIPCPRGTYSNVVDAVACRKCPRDQYNDREGLTHCLKCPETSYTVGEGSEWLSDCVGPVIELCSEEGFSGHCYKFYDSVPNLNMTTKSLRVIRGEFRAYAQANAQGQSVVLHEGFSVASYEDADISGVQSFSVALNNVFCYLGNGHEFRGRIQPSGGMKCVNWNSTALAREAVPNEFCQNPGGRREKPYCIVEDGSEVECDNVPQCVWDRDCYVGNGAGYRGKVGVTKNGRSCQNWDSDFPHPHGFHSKTYAWAGIGPHSLCRSPERSGQPWCYTTYLFHRWETCDIPECNRDEFSFYEF